MTATRALLALLVTLASTTFAPGAHAATASATMGVGLTLRAPGEATPTSVVNPGGQMRAEGARSDAIDRAIARAPRVERLSAIQPNGARVHSIQF